MLTIFVLLSVVTAYKLMRLNRKVKGMSILIDIMAFDHLKNLEAEIRQTAKEKWELEKAIERILREEG